MLWTEDEIRELIALWPTNSATQIGSQLQRPAAAITGKVKRLRDEGLLPAETIKHYDLALVQTRPKRASAASNDSLHGGANRTNAFSTRGEAPCSILDLDDNRCHWPLGEVHEVAALFCGGATEPGRRYCTHHLRLARGQA
jgi:GcrA cell cycle regulator